MTKVSRKRMRMQLRKEEDEDSTSSFLFPMSLFFFPPSTMIVTMREDRDEMREEIKRLDMAKGGRG